MQEDIVQSALVRLSRFGFQLRLTPSLAAASTSDLDCHALGAAAAVLYDVGPDAFEVGGNWSVVGQHVRANGLRQLDPATGEALSLDPVRVAAVNATLSFAVRLLALVTTKSDPRIAR
ncbi:hypothetical protein [Burkholderia pseudomallei]|uniref:hypothetical protein n=1 Tax=Burkholderia pseudomallei TaxID=28450 RepID=UPI000718074F|nr:hypothetical protein [Burkholderia pseudomallei]